MFHNVQLFQVIVMYYLQYIVHVKNMSYQGEYIVKSFFILCYAFHQNIHITRLKCKSPPVFKWGPFSIEFALFLLYITLDRS